MLRSVFIVIAGALLLSCILTPLAFEGLLWLWPDFSHPFSRVYDRVLLVAAFIMIFTQRRAFHVGSIRSLCATAHKGQAARMALSGLCISLISALLALPIVVGTGELVWAYKECPYSLRKLPQLIAGALIISLIEEIFFRGLFLDVLKKRMGFLLAAAVSSVVYAFVHFLSPVSTYKYPGFSLWVGFEYLIEVMKRVGSPGLVAGMAGLWLVGMTLCACRRWFGSIWICVGLHAGWVVSMKLAYYTTQVDPGHTFAAATGRRYFLVAQPEGWISILAVAALLFGIYKLGVWRKPA